MESINLLFVAACVLAFMSSIFLFPAVFDVVKQAVLRRRVTRNITGEGSVYSVSNLLMEGVDPFCIVARLALNNSLVAHYIRVLMIALTARGIRAREAALLSCVMLLLSAIGIFAAVISASWIAPLVLCVGVLLALNMLAGRIIDEQHEQLRESIPETLKTMKACFQVGYSLSQTVAEVVSSSTGAIHELFVRIDAAFTTGEDIESALSILKEEASEPELVFLGAALEIQHHTGSSMGQILETVSQAVSDELQLKRTLRTQTAQAKLSAQVVTLMPFVLIGLFSLVSPDFLAPFFESILGIALLIVAISMQVIGILLVRKMLKIEVG